MTPRDWDADSYQRVSAPLEAMGREVLDRLELRGDERVLDAGCGTGRVTAALVERLPRGEVVAVDGSPAMVEEARERLGPGVEVFVADLLELELAEPVDAILSTATFHWIGDHDRLFERLFAALRPGGRIVAQCGGAGNVASVQAAIDAVAEPGAGGLARAMELRRRRRRPRSGSSGSASPTSAPGRRTCASSRTTRASTSRPSCSARTSSASRPSGATRSSRPCWERLPEPAIDYVRLNLMARRPA